MISSILFYIRINSIKYIAILIFINMFLLMGCSEHNNSANTDRSSIKKHIDDSYEKLNEKYKKLCSRPRNDYLKSEFDNLRTEITKIRYISETLVNLDYQKQKEISDYSDKELNKYPALIKLVDQSKIECW